MPATMTRAARHAGKGAYDTHQAATAAMHRWCDGNGASRASTRVYPCDEDGARHYHFGHAGKRRGSKTTTKMKRW